MSSNLVFFTADTHFNDPRALDGRRPPSSVEERNERLIERWNAAVRPNDHVYHLGDVALGRAEAAAALLSRLNGRIHLVRGDHDRTAERRPCRDRFAWIRDYAELKIDGRTICMMHYPILSWRGLRRGAYHLHGHQHRRTPFDPKFRRLDVGVFGHDDRPWAYEDVDLLLRDVPYPDDHAAVD